MNTRFQVSWEFQGCSGQIKTQYSEKKAIDQAERNGYKESMTCTMESPCELDTGDDVLCDITDNISYVFIGNN